MFRYLAFAWTVADERQAALADRLERALDARSDWQAAFKSRGLRVYSTGGVRGINGAYLLPADQGVILGRLFRSGHAVMTTSDDPSDIEISDQEGQRIVRSDGRALVEHFWGRYVAFLPSWTGDARVLRDPTGTLPCYRIDIDGVSIVLSWLEDLYSLLNLPMPSVDWKGVAAHMVLGQVSGRQTLLHGVSRILPGDLTPLRSCGGAATQLWSAADRARHPSFVSPTEASQLLRDTVSTCVRAWTSCYQSVVLRLSGGVDSAILLGSLAPLVAPGGLACLNYHQPGTDSDERAYARLAAKRAGVDLLEEMLDDGFRMESILDVARTAVPANYLGGMGTSRTDAAVAGTLRANAVFNGTGGDQLFFEVRCTWPAADYLRLRGIDRQFLEVALDSAHLGRVSFWHSLREAFANRRFRGNPVEGAGRDVTLMNRDALDAAVMNAHQYVHPEWLAAQDLPIGKFQQLGFLIAPLEYYNHYLRQAAPERVHPFMSQPLLELCLATPTYVLTKGGRGRGLARAAFADLIPAEIAARRSKGSIERFVATVLQRNLPFAREFLMDGLLAKQGMLDRKQIDAALAGTRSSKTTYVSEIHGCIATEAWLRRVTAGAAPVSA